MIDSRWGAANRASGGNNAERSMLFVALMLADALDEAASQPVAPPQTIADVDNTLLARIADRLEALAETLEQPGTNA